MLYSTALALFRVWLGDAVIYEASDLQKCCSNRLSKRKTTLGLTYCGHIYGIFKISREDTNVSVRAGKKGYLQALCAVPVLYCTVHSRFTAFVLSHSAMMVKYELVMQCYQQYRKVGVIQYSIVASLVQTSTAPQSLPRFHKRQGVDCYPLYRYPLNPPFPHADKAKSQTIIRACRLICCFPVQVPTFSSLS